MTLSRILYVLIKKKEFQKNPNCAAAEKELKLQHEKKYIYIPTSDVISIVSTFLSQSGKVISPLAAVEKRRQDIKNKI